MPSIINASTSAGLVQTADTSGVLQLQTANTTAVTVDASQNVGIGTSSPNVKLQVSATAAATAITSTSAGQPPYLLLNNTADSSNSYIFCPNKQLGVVQADASASSIVYFSTQNAERMRIDSSGNLLVGTTSAAAGSSNTIYNGSNSTWAFRTQSNAGTSPNGILIKYSGASPNDAGNQFLYCEDSGNTQRMSVRSNGGIANFSANNVNLSDERTKTDIQNAGNYLNKICSIPVRTFKYKDQADNLLNLGVIAQEVESIAPELVDDIGFGDTPEDGIPLKAIYQTDLQYALMKCIQELKAELDATKAEVALLKGTA